MDPTNRWPNIGSRWPFSVASDHNSSTHTKSPSWWPPTQGFYMHAWEPEAKAPTSVLLEKMQTKPSLRFSLKEAVSKHLTRYCCWSQETKTWTKLWGSPKVCGEREYGRGWSKMDYGHFTAGSEAAVFASIKTIHCELVSEQLDKVRIYSQYSQDLHHIWF